MSAVVGMFLNKNNQVSENILIQMRDSMIHRGPNGGSVYLDGEIGLGHRKLVITDPSESPNQPYCTRDERLWIVYDGKIYNYHTLREDLKKLGYTFRTHSDVETILYSYQEWGTKCLERFNGMFAIIIYDKIKNELFIARDRLGIKPLLYTKVNEGYLFSSEVKAFFHFPGFNAIPNIVALPELLKFMCLSGEITMFKDVYQLLPGHWMRVKRKKHNLGHQIEKYWELPNPKYTINLSEDRAEKEIKELLSESIRLRLSNAPIGVQLSGGVDSSLIAAYASRDLPSKLKTITVNVCGPKHSEAKYAKYVSSKLSLESYIHDLTSQNFVKNIFRAAYYYDEPMLHSNAVGRYVLSRFAKEKGINAILVGIAADAIYVESGAFDLVRYDIIRKWCPSFLHSKVLKHFSPQRHYDYVLLENPKGTQDDIIFDHDGPLSYKEVSLLLGKDYNEVKKSMSHKRKYLPTEGSLINRYSYFHIKTYIVNLLHMDDHMSMAFSIEPRMPYLDYRLVEHAMRFPSSLKLKGRTGKFLLKRICAQIFNRDFANRKKIGFGLPLREWMLSDEFSPLLGMLEEKCFQERGWFDTSFVMKKLNEFKQGKPVYAQMLWAVIMIELWARIFIDRSIDPFSEVEAHKNEKNFNEGKKVQRRER